MQKYFFFCFFEGKKTFVRIIFKQILVIDY